MAIDVTGGDVPLAMLVAHNLLKEAAYAHRHKENMILGRTGSVVIGKKMEELYKNRHSSYQDEELMNN
jgi:hypothetical protein